MGFLILSLDSEVAVRLAHEGVPVRVIARATRIPSDEVRQQLRAAQSDGRLPELPDDDWELANHKLRATSFHRYDDQAVAAQRLFRLTRTQAAIFLLLLRNSVVYKQNSGINADSFDVHVCRLRRILEPFDLTIVTEWGHGYRLSIEHRRKATDLILQHVAAGSTL